MTSASKKRLLTWGILTSLVIASLVFAMWPRAIPVDTIELQHKPLIVTVDEEGKTRARDVYVLSAPVTGQLRRIEVEVGDPTKFNDTIIAEIDPIDPEFLDPRSEAQAEAQVHAAESALELAKAEVSQAQAELEFANTELQRAQELTKNQTISKRELDEAERLFKTRRAALSIAQASLQVRNYELERAQALLMSPRDTQQPNAHCECIRLKAPADGRILHIYHESEGVIRAGEPLLTIGDPRDLEIAVELHSSLAVKVEPGQAVIIENWGGEEALEGRVKRVEPVGFTKVSALGIEEQRVNIIIDFSSPYELWHRLGHGYQLDVRIVLWRNNNVLALPLTALFRDGKDWAVYASVDGRATKRAITLGQQNGLIAEVVDGLQAGDYVVVHPSNRVVDGVRIASRN